MTHLEYLDFNITPSGNEAKPEYLRSLREYTKLTTKRQLQGFVGACNWLHEYVPHLAITMAPLTDLLAGKRSFRWAMEAEQAFLDTKDLFKNPLILSRPRPDLPYFVQTDAYARVMEVVLFQQEPGKNRRIISHASAKFSPTEAKYHCNEQECLAIIWAIKRFRQYLEDQPFTLRTDSKGLTWLERFKDKRDKLARWSLLLQEFSFRIEHCPRKNNELPDALSRHPQDNVHVELDDQERMMVPEGAEQAQGDDTPDVYLVTEGGLDEDIRMAQQSDPQLNKLARRYLDVVRRSELKPKDQNLVKRYNVVNGALWQLDSYDQKWKLAVPESKRARVWYEYHAADTAGYPGAQETLRAIREHHHWPRMHHEVPEYVRLCHLCASIKSSAATQTNLRPHQPKEPWDTIAVDLMGPYPMTGRRKRFILVVTDLFSRWVEAFALGSSEAPVLTKKLEEEVFYRWGYPRVIISDNGPQFLSQIWNLACEKWQVHHWTTAIYHPQANPTERSNQEIK